MKTNCHERCLGTLILTGLLLGWTYFAFGQSYSSGSTGTDGAFNPASGTHNIVVRPGGVYHYTTVNIPSGATVRYVKNSDNAPLVILATGNVTIAGTIIVSGHDGTTTGTLSNVIPGAEGGPGGFDGGSSTYLNQSPPITIMATAGAGPGGGASSTGVGGQGGAYAAPSSFGLTPLFGGSGGGGGGTTISGFSGGGGGGAVLVASSTRITVNGAIRANGGNAGFDSFQNCQRQGGPGSGGAIRLVAPEIIGSGTLHALRGITSASNSCNQVLASDGRIRVEAFSTSGFTGIVAPTATVVSAPGPASPAGNPALTNVPTLDIVSVGGMAVPTQRSASYSVPDLTLPLGTANPIPVVMNLTNTPVGEATTITVRLIPRGNSSSVTVGSANHTGTFASSTATANVNLAAGQVTVLQAHAAMTLTGETASLFPKIDGEPVARVVVAAELGQSSALRLVTSSGKEIPVEQLDPEDRFRVALAWDAMKASRRE